MEVQAADGLDAGALRLIDDDPLLTTIGSGSGAGIGVSARFARSRPARGGSAAFG